MITLKFYLNKLQNILRIVFSIILIITCVYNYINVTNIVCSVTVCNNFRSTFVKSIFYRSIAIACTISRVTIMYKSVSGFPEYEKKIEKYELYFPKNDSKRKCHSLFTISIVCAYFIIIFPVNVWRVHLINHNLGVVYITVFHTMMYVQNFSICLAEIFYIIRCFELYLQFKLINEGMYMLKSETIIANKYPAVLQNEERNDRITCPESNSGLASLRTNDYQLSLSNSIELLRMRHQFVREVFKDLNDLYGIQLGLSLIFIFILMISDIYSELTIKNSKIRTKILIYAWVTQYCFRFCSIIMTTHITSKEVCNINFQFNILII